LTEPSEDVRDQLKQCTHDLNNVLGQILGFGSLLVRDLADANAAGQVPPGLVDYAQELLAAGMRGEGIAKRLAGIVRALPALPIADAPPAPAELAPRPAATAGQSGRRLLVAGSADDDLRSMAFVEAGWHVEAHRSGADALRRFRASTTPFDAVIAHPGTVEIRGQDLVAAIKALRPTTVCIVVFWDGIADEAAARLAGADAGLPDSAAGAAAVTMIDGLLRQRRSAA
jgi:hypothetical protein